MTSLVLFQQTLVQKFCERYSEGRHLMCLNRIGGINGKEKSKKGDEQEKKIFF
jgi:hypothetical protein